MLKPMACNDDWILVHVDRLECYSDGRCAITIATTTRHRPGGRAEIGRQEVVFQSDAALTGSCQSGGRALIRRDGYSNRPMRRS